MQRSRFHLLIALAAVFTASVVASAQPSSGTITGVVTDSSGSIVPGAVVDLVDAASTIGQPILLRSTHSDERGRYAFASVPPGRYRVSASLPGFDTAVRVSVPVVSGRETVVDVVLAPGRQETTIVVTAPATTRPLVVETNPRAPRQPIPAHDGGDYLKGIPGFSIVRKGGTDGDPVLRGMAGSRLGVLLDGQQIFGGCGGRMDPPTAYVYPSAFDRITVVKGPQTVLYAAGTSAGTVLFQRDWHRASRPEYSAFASFVGGGFGRHDEMANVRAAVPAFYLQAVGTRSETGDYEDGNGRAVHSAYTRWSGSAAFGWTPSENTLLELSVARSDGRAAYADRAMDGTKFARDNVAVKFDTRRAMSVVRRIEVQFYYNYVDHVMDNFSLRKPGAAFSVNNPDRTTEGGRVAVTLAGAGRASLVAGADLQHNVHTFRGAMGKTSASAALDAYRSAPRSDDAEFRQVGAFGELTYLVGGSSRVIAGVRGDWHEARDSRACLGAAACPPTAPKNDTAGARDREALVSGFGRFERDVTRSGNGTLYLGVGHTERSADYWERVKQDPVTLESAFLTARPEKTTQLDAGFTWRSRSWSGSLSGFAGRTADYIAIRWKPTPTLTRNVDANTFGAEADVSYRLTSSLRAEATMAFVRSENLTDDKPLARQPAPEGTLGLYYAGRGLSLGALARFVGRQDRVDLGWGSIVANSMDIGPTGGFSIFSLSGGYRFKRGLVVAAGIDNLFDRAYAEHMSQGGAAVPDFVQTARVNEPGRTLWMKLSVELAR
ncbi:MAG: TonB-dependent copper receptor [Vicinamibacterales bacterium]